jgi:sulfite exporter TauE/SafE
MTIAIVGGFFGAMGITEENSKKTLPILGLIFAGIFVIILGVIIFNSVSLGTS